MDDFTGIQASSGVATHVYQIGKSYPDEELEAIIVSVCNTVQLDRDALLEAFGSFITPKLINIYGSFIEESWGLFDLLEYIESTIHRTVRIQNPTADPPQLKIKRINSKAVSIDYFSKRKMIHFGIGIIKALGEHYKVEITIEKSKSDTKEVLLVKAKD